MQDDFNYSDPPSNGQGILLPPPALRKYVKYFWYYHPQKMQRTSSQFRIIPSGCPGLIFHHVHGNAAIKLMDGPAYPLFFVHGQDTTPCVNVDEGNSAIVSVRLFPTAVKTLFNIDSFEATNTAIPLDYLTGTPLSEQLVNTKNIFQVIQLISAFLLDRINKIKYRDLLVQQSVCSIIENINSITPPRLAKQFHLSQRQFQRRFKQFIGVSPEMYIHILKFQKAINLIQQNDFGRLTDLAYELAYADQSHFTRQFKTFSGLLPKKARKILSNPRYAAPDVLHKKFELFRFIYS